MAGALPQLELTQSLGVWALGICVEVALRELSSPVNLTGSLGGIGFAGQSIGGERAAGGQLLGAPEGVGRSSRLAKVFEQHTTQGEGR